MAPLTYLRVILAGIVLAAFAASVQAENRTVDINQACDSEPALMIERITLTGDRMVLHMRYTQRAGRPTRIGIHPPGDDMAFYITDDRYQQRHFLLEKDGIATLPKHDELKAGEQRRFTLTFERLATRRFHLYEGKLPNSEMVRWNCTNIDLP